MSLVERPAVRRVRTALEALGSRARVIELATTARTAADAAGALGCQQGAIVKSLVFRVAGSPVLALIAGDRRARQERIAVALDLEGPVARADADTVRQATGYSIGGVPPVGHRVSLPTVMDASLWRFPLVHAAAGHPHCVFGETPDHLASMTGAVVTADIAA